jgi:hypothetical protein
MKESLELLQEWYISNCDGDWEHSYGVKIETLDNPGWVVRIDLDETAWEDITHEEEQDNGERDWYHIKIESSKFTGGGDPTKLKFIIERFALILKQARK